MTLARALTTLGIITTLAVSAAATPAAADDSQWWYSAYNVDQAHADGFTGKGVKIAVLGAEINPSYVGLAGTHLTVDPDPICKGATIVNTQPSRASSHDTGVVALLIGNGQGASGIRGVAPDADVTFIGYGSSECSLSFDPDNVNITPFGAGLKRAMKDGAQIVSTSSASAPASEGDGEILAEAIARGIIIVSAPPNELPQQTNGEAPSSLRGVVSVAASDSNSALQTDTATGAPVIVPNVTVAAAGVDLSFIDKNSWDTPFTGTGSSIATPIVAGMLALAAQKYPKATGNQLIQSLIHNTGRDDHPLEYDPTDGFGYGGASLTHLLRVDPSQYPDENPLLGKDPRLNGAQYLPTDAQLAAAKSVPASTSPSVASPPVTAGSSPVEGVLTGVIIGGVVVLVLIIAGAVVTVVLVTRRRRV